MRVPAKQEHSRRHIRPWVVSQVTWRLHMLQLAAAPFTFTSCIVTKVETHTHTHNAARTIAIPDCAPQSEVHNMYSM